MREKTKERESHEVKFPSKNSDVNLLFQQDRRARFTYKKSRIKAWAAAYVRMPFYAKKVSFWEQRERADYHPVDFNAIFFSRAAKLKEVIKMRVKRQF